VVSNGPPLDSISPSDHDLLGIVLPCLRLFQFVDWLADIATAIWIAMATVHATRSGNRFSMGFAVAAGVWLITCLGFAIETPLSIEGKNIRQTVYRIVNFGRERPKTETGTAGPVVRYAQLHDLYVSLPMGSSTGKSSVPSGHNALRLACCLTALVLGAIAGSCCYVISRRTATKLSDATKL
jgi:hypothetical protein